MNPKKLWIVMPCFFDVESFLKTWADTRAAMALRFKDFTLEFILVDDSAGADPAIATVPKVPGLSILQMPYNLGHQAAIVYALRTVGAQVSDEDYLVTMDSDGEDRQRCA